MKNLFLLLIVLGLLFATFYTKTEGATPLLKGYIREKDINSRKLYEDTLINLYADKIGWKLGVQNHTSTQPEIAGQAGMLVDINTGDILFDKNAELQFPIASLTKIMTTVVALEHKGLQEKVFVSGDSASIGENSMGLTYGETYTLEELMYGLILVSGNDAAYAIADGVAESSDRFIEWMNFKAAELGLRNTVFTDPSGLDDGNVSTPADLAKLTRYAMQNPDFKKIVGTVETEIYPNEFHKYVYLFNQTNLLTTYPGVAGVKTGFTEAAGLCLVTYATNDGREVVGIVLDSIDRKGDMILMLDHGFSTLGVNVVHNLL